jgi:hypothetical protein
MIQELPHFRKPPCMKFNEIGPATRPATKPQTTVNAVTTRPVNQRDDVQRILEIHRKPGRNFTSARGSRFYHGTMGKSHGFFWLIIMVCNGI